jgi:enoyl-CoA hydratase
MRSVPCDGPVGSVRLVIEREDDRGPGGADVPVAVLRLAHGPVNAMDIELCRAVAERFRHLAADPARAVVVTGTGRTFSAGVDLKRYVGGGAPYVERFLPALCEMFHAVFELAKPVVAALNGHAIAGGCVLAACTDTTLMAEGGGRVGVPEIRVGVPLPRIAIEVLRHAIGDVATRRLVVGAQTYGPVDAQGIGLVDRVVPAGELLAQAVGAARAMAVDVPPDTFAMTKTQLRRDALERTASRGDEADGVAALWERRAADGWPARYLSAVTGT